MKIRTLLVGVVVAMSALATAQIPAPLKDFAAKLNAAEGLEATFSIRTVSGVSSNYSVTLAKPNKARIDTPERLVVADGESVTTYLKDSKKYFKKDQNAKELGKLLNNDEMRMFLPFFKKDAFDKSTARQLADVRRRGTEMVSIELTLDASKSKLQTLFLTKADGLLSQGTLEWKTRAGKETRIYDFATLALGAGKDVFTFKAPAGSTETTEAELLAVKWIENLDEAIAEAKASNRMVLVDFYATWCGPCHKMEADVFPTDRFKAITSQFVLCRIDVDAQPDIAKRFNIEAMPTTAILDSEGSEKGRWVGYGGFEGYFTELNRVTSGSY